MKRILLATAALLLFFEKNWAQKGPDIQFEAETVQFGRVAQGAIVDTFFTFKNVGDAPLQISKASGSCGCTRPTWPDQPIEPGGTGRIGVRFNSAKRAGEQAKTITVESDAGRAVVMLRIEGFVVAPEEKPADGAANSTEISTEKTGGDGHAAHQINVSPATEGGRPHQMESLGSRKIGVTSIAFEEASFDFGKVSEGAVVRHTFVFKNTGAETFLLSSVRDNCDCLQLLFDETLMVRPGGTGSFEAVFETTGQKGEHLKKIMVGGNLTEKEVPLTLKGRVK